MHANNDPLGVRSVPFPDQMRREDHLKSTSLPDRLSSSGRIVIVDSFQEVSSRTGGSVRKSRLVWHSSHKIRGSNQRDAVPGLGLRAAIEHRAMGFNRRKMEDQRREAAEKKAGALLMPKCLKMPSA